MCYEELVANILVTYNMLRGCYEETAPFCGHYGTSHTSKRTIRWWSSEEGYAVGVKLIISRRSLAGCLQTTQVSFPTSLYAALPCHDVCTDVMTYLNIA